MTQKSDWCVYTAFDANYRDVARISIPTMQQYAQRHGMDFRYFEFAAQNRHPSWGKIKFAEELFGFCSCIWLQLMYLLALIYVLMGH